MNRRLIVAGLCLVTVAGCGRTIVREQVVERPVVRETVVEKPVVVERPVVRETVIERQAVAGSPASCGYAGVAYSSGSQSCQAGYQYQCSNGAWERIPGSAC